MAKRAKLTTNLFAKTEKDQESQDTKIKSRGVGLPANIWAELDAIAADKNISPHALRAAGLRYFYEQHKAGAVEVTAEIIDGKVQVQAKPKG